MSVDEHKRKARILYTQIINSGPFYRADSFIAGNAKEHDPPPGTEALEGSKVFEHFFSTVRAAFPDFLVTVEDVFAEGYMIVVRWKASGTHRGTFMSVTPSTHGRRVEVSGTDTF